MKRILHTKSLGTKLLFLCMLFGLGSFSAMAQKDILLYETNFSDWEAVKYSSSSSNPFMINTGAGAGFMITQDATVDPNTTAIEKIMAGKYWLEGSTSAREFKFKEFSFIGGAVVEVLFELNLGSSDRKFELLGGTVSECMIDTFYSTGTIDYKKLFVGTNLFGTTTLDKTMLGKWYTGSTIGFPKNAKGYARVSFHIPNVSGAQTFSLKDIRKDFPIRQIKVYSGVGSTKYVASTNYAAPKAHALQGAVSTQAAPVQGSPVNESIKVQGWNLGGADIKLTIEGADASKFAITGADADGSFTVPNAQALAGFAVPVVFNTSVREGISNAQLKIESSNGGCPPYYVSLTGVTGAVGAKKILASQATIPFYTSLIAAVSQQFTFAGVDLDCDVTLSFTGAGSERFSVSETTVSSANANAGRTVKITYTGDIEAVEQNVNLVLTASCAVNSPLTIPLYAVTEDVIPDLRNVVFKVNPEGAAFLDLSMAGPTYKLGSTVNVKVYPEVNWRITGWSNSGTKSSDRNFIVSIKTEPTITVNLEASTGAIGGGSVDGFVALTPTVINNTGFTAKWSNATEAGVTGYEIRVYDKNNSTPIASIPVGLINNQAVDLTAYLPNPITEESDLLFYYDVVATGALTPETTAKAGPIRLTGTVPFTCGQ